MAATRATSSGVRRRLGGGKGVDTAGQQSIDLPGCTSLTESLPLRISAPPAAFWTRRCTLSGDARRRNDMTERFVTRGFVGRRTAAGSGDVAGRIPPGQYLTTDFPVLSAGPTPRTPLDRWSFTIEGLVRQPVTWTWTELTDLPDREWVVDISCVTKWTKLDMHWRGVS